MDGMREMKQDVGMLKTHVAGLLKSSRATAMAVVRLEARMDRLEAKLTDSMTRGFKTVLDRFDDFAGEVQASRRERALQDQTFNTLNERLIDHELRVTRLERERKS